MKSVLFANADIVDYSFCREYLEDADTIICCDGGMRHTKRLGIVPDYILGDFDSVSPEILKYYKDMGVKSKQFPSKKDETDMEIGVNYALELGADEIIIIGGIGSRVDHTLANIHLLHSILKKGAKAKLVNENNCIELIDKYIEIYGEKGDLISLIPFTMEVKGITIKGFEYKLEDAVLTINSPRGISNVMIGNKASVSIGEGLLFVIKSRDYQKK